MKPRIVFMGTPEFAVPTLHALVETSAYEIVAVVTQPDKPANRGQELTPPPVKVTAEKLGLSVWQPASLKKTPLETGPLDALVVVAYGKILPDSLLQQPRVGAINIHPSLLPRWRGAAPIQYALFSGDKKTGVAIMQIDEGMDTGPVYVVEEEEIRDSDDFGTLHDRLAQISARLMVKTLPAILSGACVAQPQAAEGSTYADKWDKDDQSIKWDEAAAVTLRRIRTCAPHLGARAEFGSEAVKVFRAHEVKVSFPHAEPGTIVEVNRQELVVATGSSGYIALDEIQFPGKKRLAVQELLKGRSFNIGDRFTKISA